MTLLYTDPLFLKHDTGAHHPERIDRMRVITDRLDKNGLAKQCRRGVFDAMSEEEVARTHSRGMIESVKRLCEEGGGYLDGDTIVSHDSYAVGLAAAGACTAAVDAVLKGPDCNALCLVR